MKIIAPRLHGIIDYVLVLFLLLSPTLFNMDNLLASFTYSLGIVHLLITICTSFSMGFFKLIPFPAHGLIELVVGVALIIVAYTLFRTSETGNLFYTALGSAILLVWLLSDYTTIQTSNLVRQ